MVVAERYRLRMKRALLLAPNRTLCAMLSVDQGGAADNRHYPAFGALVNSINSNTFPSGSRPYVANALPGKSNGGQ